MNTITKRLSAFGVTGVAATALLIGGLAAPAQASEPDRSTDTSSSVEALDTADLDALGSLARGGVLFDALTGNTGGNLLVSPTVNGPLVDRSLTGDLGDVASGNEVSGNDVGNGTEIGNGAAIGSGNDVPVVSGNDTDVTAPVTAPIDVPVDAPIDAPVDAPVGSGNDAALDGISDIDTSVTDTVDGALDGLNLGAVLGR
ncbi:MULTISPECIES: hypothetical protein [Cryobacterium]|uniref:Uncharacterized protein n=1 Tax=Cryobacterium breve TaxID=1259258 RepID=A0ABY2J0S4_9MICO|nr:MULTISPECIES: hypothetical protein [Cryobacterium]TFC95926.1 hypothetical protein E3T20_04185 [Cryobacterium sp. TmT3-12]TFC97897.1 hypothetical protein E3O65_09225 [Cryobacterium breve]